MRTNREVTQEAVVRIEADAAEVRVAPQVVEKVGADGVGDDVEDEVVVVDRVEGFRDAGTGTEQRHQPLVEIVAEPLEKDAADLAALAEKAFDALVVLVVPREDAELVLDRVAERHVGDVVKQRVQPDQLFLLRRNLALIALRLAIVANDADHPIGHREDAEGVIEARVHRRRVDEVHGAELLDAAQPLEVDGIDASRLETVQVHVTGDGDP